MVASADTTRARRLSLVFSVVGIVLVVAALAVLSYNLLTSGQTGLDAADVLSRVERQMPEERSVYAGQAQGGRMPMVQVDGNSYVGVLEFPRFDVRLPVLAAYTDDAAALAPGVYAGSVYGRTCVIAGSNAAAIFGDLTRFSTGDEVVFTDVNGQEFHYRVATFETFSNGEVADIATPSDDWDLTLFSSSFSGQNQVVVRLVLE